MMKGLDMDCVDKKLIEEYMVMMSSSVIDRNNKEDMEMFNKIVDKITFNLIANSKKDYDYTPVLKMCVQMELASSLIQGSIEILNTL